MSGVLQPPRWEIRPPRSGDESFLVYSWLKCLGRSDYAKRHGGSGSAEIGCTDEYWEGHKKPVMRLLRDARVDVLCDPDDDDIIWAWACYEGASDVVHFTLAKAVWNDGAVSQTMLRALLGARLERPAVLTYPPEGMRFAKLPVPRDWKLDEYWMAKRWA